jgi:hypothetical protein
MLCEEAKLKNLRESILEAANNERNGLLVISLGVFLVSAGLIFSVIIGDSVAYLGGIFIIALGIFTIIFGFSVSVHYSHRYNNLLEELDIVQFVKKTEK